MNRIRKRLVHLHRCRYMTRNRIRKIISLDSTLTKIYRLTSVEISQLLAIPTQKSILLYHDLHNPEFHHQIREDMKTYQIVTLVDESYPSMLKTIKDPPLVLYAIGDLNLLNRLPALSVIGTRQPTSEAQAKVNLIVTPLVKENWIIVSGMAKGIDSLAHHTSLEYHGKTIAVLGGGFHHIYPK